VPLKSAIWNYQSEIYNSPMTTRTRTDVLLIAGFCAFLFFYGMSQFGLIGADEPRYAQVAREMLERRDWITPTLGGHAWLEKPPLYYWQAMLAYSALGRCRPHHRFLCGSCRLRPCCLDGYGSGRDVRHWNAGLVGVA